jgi:hypothetical protein
MPRIALTIIAAALASLTLASTAHAKWVTVGRGDPPVVKLQNPCTNGWEFGWAWFDRDRVAAQPQPASLTTNEFVVSIGWWDFGQHDVVLPHDVLYRGQHTVAFRRTFLSSNVNDQLFLPYRPGSFDFVLETVFKFNRSLAPGTRIRVQGIQAPGQAYAPLGGSKNFTVEDCWIGPAIDNG